MISVFVRRRFIGRWQTRETQTTTVNVPPRTYMKKKNYFYTWKIEQQTLMFRYDEKEDVRCRISTLIGLSVYLSLYCGAEMDKK